MKRLITVLVFTFVFVKAQAHERETGGSLIPVYPQYNCVGHANATDNSIYIAASKDLSFWEVFHQIADDEYEAFPLTATSTGSVETFMNKSEKINLQINADHTASVQYHGVTYDCESASPQQLQP